MTLVRNGANAEHDSENIIMSIARAEFEKDIEANDAANKLDASLEVESVVQNRTSAEIDSESIDMSIARDGMMDKISRVSNATQLSDEEAANDFDAVLGVESIKGNRVITELNSINTSIDWAGMLDSKSRKKDIEADKAANNFDAALGVESTVGSEANTELNCDVVDKYNVNATAATVATMATTVITTATTYCGPWTDGFIGIL